MLKKMFKLAALIGLIIIPKAAFAMVRTYGADLINDPTLAYSTAPVLQLDDIDTLAMQATYSSAVVNAQTFRDGQVSTASITISSYTALSTAAATDSIVIASNTALAGTFASVTIYISSNPILISTNAAPVILQINGSSATLGANWTGTTFATQTAKNLATAINSLGIYGISAATGALTGSSVTVTATLVGSSFNSMRVVSSTPTLLQISSSTLLGGRDLATLIFNGQKFVANKDDLVDLLFASNTALNIANMLNFSTYGVTATTPSVVSIVGVNFTALQAGTPGNLITLSASTAAFTIRSASFTGGVDAAIFKFNGITFTAGIDFFNLTNASTTARSLSDALMANSVVNTLIITTYSAAAVITATSTAINKNTYLIQTSTQFAMTISGFAQAPGTVLQSTFTGGVPSNISIALFPSSNTILISTHGVTTGFPFWWQTLSGSTPTPLNVGTTYYAIRVDQNYIQLALTSTGALAGLNISITSQTITGGSFFKLNPVVFAGSPSFKWQASNDNLTYFDLPIDSVTYSSAGNTMWDGTVNYRYVRFNYIAGSGGGMKLKVTGNGKKFDR